MLPSDNIDIPDRIREIILRSARKESRDKLILALIMCLVGVAIVVFTDSAITRVAGFGMITGGVIWLSYLLPGIGKKPALLVALETGEQIVWFYTGSLELMPFGVYLFRRNRIYINSLDRRVFAINIAGEEEGLLLSWFRLKFPRASVGYSEEKSELFRKDPALMRSSMEDD